MVGGQRPFGFLLAGSDGLDGFTDLDVGAEHHVLGCFSVAVQGESYGCAPQFFVGDSTRW